MDRKDLKIQALLERVSSLTTAYESQDADRRVELTLLTEERDRLLRRVQELEAPDAEVKDEGYASPDQD